MSNYIYNVKNLQNFLNGVSVGSGVTITIDDKTLALYTYAQKSSAATTNNSYDVASLKNYAKNFTTVTVTDLDLAKCCLVSSTPTEGFGFQSQFWNILVAILIVLFIVYLIRGRNRIF